MLFGDGLAVLGGKGGEVARADAMPSTRQMAAELKPQQPPPVWTTPLPEESTDFAIYLNGGRLLVGTVESGATLGIPDYRDLILYDTRRGAELWRSSRPELRKGSYRVLATEPLLVLAGNNKEELYLAGYDLQTGNRRWERRFDDPFRFLVQQDRLLVAGFRKRGWSLTLLDVASGAVRWERQVATHSPNDQPRQVVLTGQDALLVSGEVQAVRLADGEGHWIYRPESLRPLSLSFVKEHLLLVGLEGAVMLDAGLGTARWQLADDNLAPVRISALHGERLYLLRGISTMLGGPGQTAGGGNRIEAIDLRRGKRLWSYNLPQPAASALLPMDGGLYLSTRNQLLCLDPVLGKPLFQRTLPQKMIAASPTEAVFAGQPDLLVPHGKSVVLARVLYGVAAFAAQTGKTLWAQPHHPEPSSNPYTADQQANLFQQTLKLYGYLPAKQQRQPLGLRTGDQLQESSILQVMQRSADVSIAQADRTLDDRNTTRLGRQAAHSSKINAINSSMIAERMAHNRAAIEAMNDLMLSLFDLNTALANALKQQAHQGLFERLMMKMDASNGARSDAFHGNYYLWPFQERGRGLTIVDLNTGRRNDLIFAPMVPPLTDYGLDLPTYAVNPAGDQLVTFGVPLDAGRYEDYVKWKWRIPRAATMAFDLTKLKYAKRSSTADYWQKNLRTDLVEWASRGDLDKVRELLARGVGPNQEKYTITPLWMAIFRGHEQIVKELIAHGANVNWEHTMMRLRPLEMARNVGASKAIISMLEAAGAKEL
ncbi:MAG: PQQ-binding-like beta-propeller repeat protein [Gammaproteobacteria bacterium]|nr:PQQ-binding-like beta-propeller repeat protein [Gammaproteobacteria bacterium]MBU1480672.1 PQQ-binding-like beta-propeller repeat protein [Gammaproteobacteria bacterium]